MKNTIGQRILVVILAPSILIFGLLSAFIVYAASHFMTVWAQLDLKGISEINAADLTGRVHSMRMSVLSAAAVLNTLDSGDGRTQAENIIKSMFENPHVHNAWLAYEPGAFDGRDEEYRSDYPGAPSGRFIRSYVLEDGRIVTAPDMDEETLDDPIESPWYVKPRDTGMFYTDASSDTPNLYDYGTGDEPICTMAFTSPIFRDGKVVGCVGADMSVDLTTLNAGKDDQAAVAVFYPDGHVFFSEDLAFADDSVDTLGFTEASAIKESFSEGSTLFLSDQYSMFLDEETFTYFQPVAVSDEDNLYLYTAIPRSDVLNSLAAVFLMIAGIVVAVFIFMLFIIVYVKRNISTPIQSLMLAADAVSMGDLETKIPSFPNSKDEIGGLSRSLHRMVEQFRIYILRLEQTQEEKIIYSKIDDLIATSGVYEVMKGILALLCERFGVDKAIAVRLSDGSARIFSRHEAGAGNTGTEFPHDFLYNSQVMPMISGKKILLMNSYIISEKRADFLDKETRFACVLPLRDDGRTLGYIILESKGVKNPFGAGTESILCNITETLSSFVKNDETRTEIPETLPAVPSEKKDAAGALGAVGEVEGLDCAAAIKVMCGMAELYEQALKLMTSMLPEIIEKLDARLDSDMDAFAIEIHGLKGSLNNVGAYAMGAEASRIEQAIRSGDESLGRVLYSSFKESLNDFYMRLIKAFEIESGKLPGNVLELVGLLPEAEKMIAAGDCAAVFSQLLPMGRFTFDSESDVLLTRVLRALEISEKEKALEDIRNLRERLSNWEGV